MAIDQHRRQGIGADPPVREHHDPVPEQQRLGHVVGDHDGGEAEPLVQRAIGAAQFVPCDRVERSERLVHQHQRRSGCQRPRKADPLRLASGQGLRRPPGEIAGEADEVEQLAYPRLPLFRARPEQAGHDRDIFRHAHVRKQPDALEDVADPAAQLEGGHRADVAALQQDPAAVDLAQPVDRLEEGRLARAGPSDEDEKGSPGDRQADAVEDDPRAEAPRNILQLEEWRIVHGSIVEICRRPDNPACGPGPSLQRIDPQSANGPGGRAMDIVAVDIGGTRARFATARIEDGRVLAIDEPCVLNTGDYASLRTAWDAFADRAGRPLPGAVSIAIAGPVQGEVLKLTNASWIIRPDRIPEELDVDDYELVNDFGAVGHAVAQLGEDQFMSLCGDGPLESCRIVSILGPGTGMGVALLIRDDDDYRVVETEGGHIDFAPRDLIEDRILARLRDKLRRVSVERIVSGPGLMNIYEVLASIEGRPVRFQDDPSLWTAAIERTDSLAAAALDRLCLALGGFAGDLALVHGAQAVVIAGGIGHRLAGHLPRSGFRDRFIAKGRFERRMDAIPVKLITYPEPGLYGAAAAFAHRRTRGGRSR